MSWHVNNIQHCGTLHPFYLVFQKLLCFANFYSQGITSEMNASSSLTVTIKIKK
jgi:hypothetical protein